ncbi:UNVERIFIED_CONTAM: hypothetical protein FKN15_066503 [Acipenser sinensis]
MPGFHSCTTCKRSIPSEKTHNQCVWCLGPEHAQQTFQDHSFCEACAVLTRCSVERRHNRFAEPAPSTSSHRDMSPSPRCAALPLAVRSPVKKRQPQRQKTLTVFCIGLILFIPPPRAQEWVQGNSMSLTASGNPEELEEPQLE